MNVADFLAMGGYAAYVWPSFGLVLIVMIHNVRAAKKLHADARAQVMRRLDTQGKRS